MYIYIYNLSPLYNIKDMSCSGRRQVLYTKQIGFESSTTYFFLDILCGGGSKSNQSFTSTPADIASHETVGLTSAPLLGTVVLSLSHRQAMSLTLASGAYNLLFVFSKF